MIFKLTMKKIIPTVLSILLLSACASNEPTHIALNPTLGAVSLHTNNDTAISFEMVDKLDEFWLKFSVAAKMIIVLYQPIGITLVGIIF